MSIKQGDIFLCNLGIEGSIGAEVIKDRPALVVSNDVINKHSSTVIVAPLTSRFEPRFPTQVKIFAKDNIVPVDSLIMLEQVRTVDKQRFSKKLGALNKEQMEEVARAWMLTTMLGEEEFKAYAFTEQRFVLNQNIDLEEDYEYEFKEVVAGIKPRDVVKEKLIPYVAGFLNDEGGRILYGIRDKDCVVTGLPLTIAEKDDIRQLINNKMDAIYPRVSPAAYAVSFHEVYDSQGRVIDNMFVLEVVVYPPANPTIVYFVDRNKIYSKVNGGKKALEWTAIQDFIHRKAFKGK
ncbi:type II toxin-antitoxin system PemK/MazF family toxin [Priestia aryabhattai]|uniref:type II toxin-antitoxin system PemK/MazF family toxin n=1 Tax=Priestia aryabhattai TaxID=412384 RepID=UPI003D2CA75A